MSDDPEVSQAAPFRVAFNRESNTAMPAVILKNTRKDASTLTGNGCA